MEICDIKKAVNIVNGTTAAGSLQEALEISDDQILINEDPIHVGPALATHDLVIWRSARERFIRDQFIELPYDMHYRHSNNWLTLNLERLGEAPVVVIWIALGLPEQLLLAWMIFLFDRLEQNLSKLWIVQIESMLPGQRILSVGEIRPEQINQYCPEPRQLTPDEIEELRRAWRIYTSDNPSDLPKYIAEPSPIPLLHEALSQLVDRYPDRRSGLSVWDEALLHYTAEKGPKAVSAVGYSMGYVGSERLDYVSDDYLFPRLMALGRPDLASPLISISGSSLLMRESRVELTPFGQKVLAGEANHVEANGIDDWVGGVHLSSAEGNVTFRDGDTLVLPR